MSKVPPEAVYTLMATAGGLAKIAHQYTVTKKFDLFLSCANLILSVFAGVAFAIFMETMGMGGDGIVLAAAIGSWSGSHTLDYISSKMHR